MHETTKTAQVIWEAQKTWWAKKTCHRPAMAELSEVNLTWDKAQQTVQNRDKWREINCCYPMSLRERRGLSSKYFKVRAILKSNVKKVNNTLLFQKLRQRRRAFRRISTRSKKHLWQCHDVSLPLDCSQPSIFSYFYSMVEHADRIARQLDASAKLKTWLGSGWGPRKIEGL